MTVGLWAPVWTSDLWRGRTVFPSYCSFFEGRLVNSAGSKRSLIVICGQGRRRFCSTSCGFKMLLHKPRWSCPLIWGRHEEQSHPERWFSLVCLPSSYWQVTRTADGWNNEESLLSQALWSSIAKLLETGKSAAMVGNSLERVVLMASLGQLVYRRSRRGHSADLRGEGEGREWVRKMGGWKMTKVNLKYANCLVRHIKHSSL